MFLLNRNERFLELTLADCPALLYPPAWRKNMQRIMQTINTTTFAEAAQAVSVPSWRLPANDGSRLGAAVALVERCMR
jgi:hypothetical protein